MRPFVQGASGMKLLDGKAASLEAERGLWLRRVWRVSCTVSDGGDGGVGQARCRICWREAGASHLCSGGAGL